MPEVRGRGFLSSIGFNANQTRVDSSKGGGSSVEQQRIAAAMRNRRSSSSVADHTASYQQSTITLDGLGFNNEVAWTVPASRRLMRIDVHVELDAPTTAPGDPEPKVWVQVADGVPGDTGSGSGENCPGIGLGASAFMVSPAGAPITVSVDCPDLPGATGVVTLHASPAA